jgi:hypothetical protein
MTSRFGLFNSQQGSTAFPAAPEGTGVHLVEHATPSNAPFSQQFRRDFRIANRYIFIRMQITGSSAVPSKMKVDSALAERSN